VNRGDETLESLFPPKDEQPEWATFDEDLGDEVPAPSVLDGERLTEGRFALFTGGEPDGQTDGSPATAASGQPEVVKRLDYETLTLAQLRELGRYRGFLLDGFPRTVSQAESLERASASVGARVAAVLSLPPHALMREETAASAAAMRAIRRDMATDS